MGTRYGDNRSETRTKGVQGKFVQMVMLGAQRIQDPYYHGVAAQVAFYLLLAMFPLLLVLSQFLSFFDVPIEFANRLIETYIPGNLGNELNSMLTVSGDPVKNNIFMIVLALWAASRATFIMARIINYTMTAGLSTGKSFFAERMRAIGTLFIIIVALTLILIILAYGDVVTSLVVGIVNPDQQMQMAMDPWLALRWPLSAVMYFFFIGYLYYILPADRGRFRDVIPGSIFSSIGMIIVTYVYSIYNNYTLASGNYNILYGSLASIVAMMFWFWFISWVICLGSLVNRLWIDTSPVERRHLRK